MSQIEIRFSSYTNTVRLQRASSELLCFKLEKFEENAKKIGMKNRDIEKGSKRILKTLTKLDGISLSDNDPDSLTFLLNNQIFGNLTSSQLQKDLNFITSIDLMEEEILIDYNSYLKGVYIIKSGLMMMSKGQIEFYLRGGDTIGMKEGFQNVCQSMCERTQF